MVSMRVEFCQEESEVGRGNGIIGFQESDPKSTVRSDFATRGFRGERLSGARNFPCVILSA